MVTYWKCVSLGLSCVFTKYFAVERRKIWIEEEFHGSTIATITMLQTTELTSIPYGYTLPHCATVIDDDVEGTSDSDLIKRWYQFSLIGYAPLAQIDGRDCPISMF